MEQIKGPKECLQVKELLFSQLQRLQFGLAKGRGRRLVLVEQEVDLRLRAART